MTVSNQTPRNGPYTGNGSTTSFSYTFRADLEAELVVVLEEGGTETVQTLTTHYTTTGIGNTNGGTIEMVTAPTSDQTLTIRRDVTHQQSIDLQNRKSVIPQVIEDGFDELTRQMQDLAEQVERAALFPVSGSLTGLEYPTPSAGTAIGWNATGDGLENLSTLPTATLSASSDNGVLTYNSGTGGIQDTSLKIDGTHIRPIVAAATFTLGAASGDTQHNSDNYTLIAETAFTLQTATELMLTAAANGAVAAYYDNTKKFETTSGGVSVAGDVDVTGSVAATSFSGDGSNLTGIDAGATGGGSDKIFWENDQTVTTDYTITNNQNAMSAGPITINSGITVTVGAGETWTVV